jgi:hypothetical protein
MARDMMTTTITRQGGELLYWTSETGDKIDVVTEERAEQIISSRKEQGWRAWREVRDADGRLLDCLLTILCAEK